MKISCIWLRKSWPVYNVILGQGTLKQNSGQRTCSLWSIKVIVTAAVKKLSCFRVWTEQGQSFLLLFLSWSWALLITVVLSFFWLSLARLLQAIKLSDFTCLHDKSCNNRSLNSLGAANYKPFPARILIDAVWEGGSNKVLWYDHVICTFLWYCLLCCTRLF